MSGEIFLSVQWGKIKHSLIATSCDVYNLIHRHELSDVIQVDINRAIHIWNQCHRMFTLMKRPMAHTIVETRYNHIKGEREKCIWTYGN